MKHLYKMCTACLALACMLWNAEGLAQNKDSVQARVTARINSKCFGYLEYLPAGYDPAGAQRYPVIIYFHGDGDRGDGSGHDLKLLKRNALPSNIENNTFPTSFTVGGKTWQFIVISPQYTDKLYEQQTDSVIQYVKDHYKVDTNRIYLTGMSLGGGIVWEYAGFSAAYAKRLAGIIPISAYTTPRPAGADRIAAANLPVWATHNNGDRTSPVSNTNDYIRLINERPTPPVPLAKKTIFNSNDHDAWTQTYSTAFTENGMNIFQWALQYSAASSTLPVSLSSYRISSATKQGVVIDWSTAFEQNNQYFSIERSANGTDFTTIGKVAATNAANGSPYSFTDTRPLTGNNYYRLSQTDLNGKPTYYSVLKATLNSKTGSHVLFPNPASASITIGFNHPDKERLTVKLINEQGILVQSYQYDKAAGYWQQTIPVAQLANGQYYIQVKGAKTDLTQPLVIRH